MAQQKQRQFVDKKSKKLEEKKTLSNQTISAIQSDIKRRIFHQNLRNTQPPDNKPEQNTHTHTRTQLLAIDMKTHVQKNEEEQILED